MNYKNSKEKTSEGEILSGEDKKLRTLLGDLKKVTVPKDFDFRLKARIANAKSVDYQPQFFPVLRYVLPLGLIVLISAVVVFNSVYFGDARNTVPVIAEIQNQNENSLNKLPSIKQTGEETFARKTDDKFSNANISNSEIVQDKSSKQSKAEVKSATVKSIRKANLKVPQKGNNVDNSGGSHVNALRTQKEIINPLGIVPGKEIKNLPNEKNIKSFTAKDILSQLGIEAIFTDEGWKVKYVRKNSAAERSGIKTGDAVEAIDGEKLTDKPFKNRTIEGKKLTVARGAEKVEITLINKLN